MKSYVNGETNTSYLPRVYSMGFAIPKLSEAHFDVLQGVATVLEINRSLRLFQIKNRSSSELWEFVALSKAYSTLIHVKQSGKHFVVCVRGKELLVREWDLTRSVVALAVGGEEFILQIHGRGNGALWRIGFQGATYDFQLMSPYTDTLRPLMPKYTSVESAKELLSPMPGIVRAVAVKSGDKVFKGQEVCVIGKPEPSFSEKRKPLLHETIDVEETFSE